MGALPVPVRPPAPIRGPWGPRPVPPAPVNQPIRGPWAPQPVPPAPANPPIRGPWSPQPVPDPPAPPVRVPWDGMFDIPPWLEPPVYEPPKFSLPPGTQYRANFYRDGGWYFFLVFEEYAEIAFVYVGWEEYGLKGWRGSYRYRGKTYQLGVVFSLEKPYIVWTVDDLILAEPEPKLVPPPSPPPDWHPAPFPLSDPLPEGVPPLSVPAPSPKSSPKPKTTPKALPQAEPAPSPNPSRSPLPNPLPKPLPRPSPDPLPRPSPYPAPSPKPKPRSDGPSSPGKGSPDRDSSSDVDNSGNVKPRPEVDRKPEERRDPDLDCCDILIEMLQRVLENQKPESIDTLLFDKCEDGAPRFMSKKLLVPRAFGDAIDYMMRSLAALQGADCAPNECYAVVPEWWQLRPEAGRPQLILQFGADLGDGKIGPPHYVITIPHYSGPALPREGGVPPLGPYWKGNYQAIATLADNSKIIINARSWSEAEQVVLQALQLTGQPDAPIKIGQHKGLPFGEIRVLPRIARYFSSGLRNTVPEWIAYFS